MGFIKTYSDDGLHGGILSESDNAVNQVTIRIAKLEIVILKLSIECPGKLQRYLEMNVLERY